MAIYNWAVDNSGEWTTPSNWGAAAYPNSLADEAHLSKAIAATRTVSVSSPVLVGAVRVNHSSSYDYILGGSGRITFASSGYFYVTTNLSTSPYVYVDTQILSQSASPIAFTSNSNGVKIAVLRNTSNQIYQIGTNAVWGKGGVGFNNVLSLGIQHPTHIYDPTASSTFYFVSTGVGGTLAKSLWNMSGTTVRDVTISPFLVSNGTMPVKIGVSGSTVNFPPTTLTSARLLSLGGTMSPYSDTDDNEIKDSFFFGTGASTSVRKFDQCRWILSGSFTGAATSAFTINDGYLQTPVSNLVVAKIPAITFGAATACLEVSGTGTLTSPITLLSTQTGPSGKGAIRAVTNASVTIGPSVLTLTTGGQKKFAASTNATLTFLSTSFVTNPQNLSLIFGGEGTVDFQYALAGTSTAVAITKEDSGTLRMSTNDKTYAAPTNVNGGTLLCDGYNRISNSNLVTVVNGAKLRTTATTTTVLSVKALTLNAGSTIQVG